MRKVDLVPIVLVVALGAAWLRPAPKPSPQVTATPSNQVTKSGKWEVLPCRYTLAGLIPGMTAAEVEVVHGKPTRKRQENEYTALWTYPLKGAELQVSLLDGRVVMVGGNGRWPLTEDLKSRPGFGATQEQVRAAFGEPQRYEQAAWVYNPRPSELSFTFERGVASQIRISSEIKGRLW